MSLAFTATQIPDISRQKIPKRTRWKNSILMYSHLRTNGAYESNSRIQVDECVFSYSDLHYGAVMSLSAIVNAAGPVSFFWVLSTCAEKQETW